MNWEKVSTISLWTLGVIVIIDAFAGKYIPNHTFIFFGLECLLLSIFIFSELMKLIVRIRLKEKNKDVTIELEKLTPKEINIELPADPDQREKRLAEIKEKLSAALLEVLNDAKSIAKNKNDESI